MWRSPFRIAGPPQEDWQYYTLAHPVASYKNFSWEELIEEMARFSELFYSYPRIFRRFLRMAIWNWRSPLKLFGGLVANLTYRYNHLRDRRVYSIRNNEMVTLEAAEAPALVGLGDRSA